MIHSSRSTHVGRPQPSTPASGEGWREKERATAGLNPARGNFLTARPEPARGVEKIGGGRAAAFVCHRRHAVSRGPTCAPVSWWCLALERLGLDPLSTVPSTLVGTRLNGRRNVAPPSGVSCPLPQQVAGCLGISASRARRLFVCVCARACVCMPPMLPV